MNIDLVKIQLRIKLSEPDLGLMEIVLHPGADSGLHRHTQERETFYVLDGTLTFTLEGQTMEVSPGGSLSIPAHTLHRFQNNCLETARAVVILNPGGLVNFFIKLRTLLDQQAPSEAFARLNADHGLKFER